VSRKKRRKSSKSKGFGAVLRLVEGTGRAALRIFPMVVISAAAAGLFLGVRTLLYADSNLAVSKITVEPPTALSIAARAALESEHLGKNILRVDLNSIAEGLEKNPQIQNARVIRRLPSELKIEITGREPLALIQLAPRGPYAYVSEDGMILEVSPHRDMTYVLIEAYGLGMSRPVAGTQIRTRGFTEAVRFLRSFWAHPVARRESLTRLAIDHLGNLTITLGEGPAFRLGRDPDKRLAGLEKAMPLLEDEGRRGIDYVDLQFDDVIVKRKR